MGIPNVGDYPAAMWDKKNSQLWSEVTYHTPRTGRNHGFANFDIMNLPTGTTSDEPRGFVAAQTVTADEGFFCNKDL